ncbi:ABC transporter substrate-binding protein [Paracoccus sp. CPCC 101403]|uniref:ABC transporter substrate-binding protein n=2 Tax=Paracoccus broussonetiae TaxID=3075834 RepID=A0ABU3EA32_9RHOB|nr:ABC transporter substrate-binding protein [Paracoccus sp. CPCC 101403]MDT1061079.1 ABC transporter substrate-binding protein [Paracoccus sp. CPCC 101403]
MNKLALALAAGLPAAAFAGAASADCGSFTIASMNWQSAEVLANLDQFILNEGYGCDAEITTSDTVPAITSLVEKGQPEVVPESWVDLMPEVVAGGLKDGKIVELSRSLSDGGQQGWFIPRYMLDEHPNLNKIEEILAHPELFPAPEDASKGAVYNGPQGWGGTVVTTQLAKAFDIEGKGFTLVDTGSAAGLDGSMAKAYEQKAPWLGFYWSPTSMLGKYDMVPVDFGMPNDMAEWKRCTSVSECADPKQNAFPRDNVFTLVSKSFAEKTDPAVIDYLSKRSWTNDTVNTLMAWMTDNQATGEDGAREFLKTHEDLWTAWVTPEAAEKIKSAL